MNLRNLRNKRGLRRNFVADTVGICGKHLNDIEGGRVNLTQKVAEKLAELYQLDVGEIFKMYKEGQNYE
ncbi:helix-turn-helix domain-containing protein [Clostridium nigeriense]|uniref:helix-turn-helix domain-containing protein n=1 Tax=Clostridium nigeriense TaxID=1805470 RepID=UPI003D340A32